MMIFDFYFLILLYETLQRDFKAALKERDSGAVSVLRMINAAIKNRELEKRNQLRKTEAISDLEKLSKLTDEEITEVLRREAKKRKEAIEGFRAGAREELALGEEEELKFIEKYLPKQLAQDEVNTEIEKIIAEIKPKGPQDFGRVMGALMAKLRGKVDGKIAGELLKNKLAAKL